jgi:hypothetical protein
MSRIEVSNYFSRFCKLTFIILSQVSIKKENGKTAMVPVFQSLENIAGEVLAAIFCISLNIFQCFFYTHQLFQVSIEPVQGKKVEHTGVKIELLGQIGTCYFCGPLLPAFHLFSFIS